jgi:hypothetical protein
MKFKVEMQHPNSMRIMYRGYFKKYSLAKKAYNEFAQSAWNDVTLFKKINGKYTPTEHN